MIISEHKPFEEIRELLKDAEKIVLIGCGECATACKSGGEEELIAMTKKLEDINKQVLGFIVPETSCNYLLVRRDLRKIRDTLNEADAVLSFACGDGVQTVA
ncbi:MAG TPA: 5,10-methylenetetrahydrofolate reductase, partial [Thermoanaerobacterales bacterium]|nr:5,10-methylenetetrahydrofolate reductase [Thermoanaerobacterales bacterium]